MTDITVDDLLQMPIFSLPIPETLMARHKAFIREMAYGALLDLWDAYFSPRNVGDNHARWNSNAFLSEYLERKWVGKSPNIFKMTALGYVSTDEKRMRYELTTKAFALLEEAPEAPIFISYRRPESSTFALLVAERMKNAGLNPFLDITSLEPGVLWEEQLRAEIEKRDIMVCLIGPTTLDSEWVCKEIISAHHKGERARLIPVFHNGFSIRKVEEKYATASGETHTAAQIILARQAPFTVTREDASEYNRVITELLGFLGV